MAHFLRGYDYEPEYTADELEARSKEAVSVCATGEPASVVANWCLCACCCPMPTLAECVCCRSSDLTSGNLREMQCITADRRMQTVVRNEDVLAVMYVQMMWDTGKQGLAPDTLDDKQNRLMAYRAFVSWMKRGKHLGKGKRIVIPSCVVNCIRDKFPAPDGQYTGFQLAEYPV